jgi:NIMA-interacting peptidyl-prolyl cis-trans isomerase 1
MQKWIEDVVLGSLTQLAKDQRPMAEKFAALAHSRSDCGSFQNGGDLGEFGHAEMQSQFEEGTWALKVGEVSGIVESDSGTHIIFRTA